MGAKSFDPAREGATGSAERPVFVSRSARARATVEPLLAEDGAPLPSLCDSHVRWILGLALCLQVFAWWRVDGYQLADSVEFMERARIIVHGEQMVDAGAVRPIGFSFVLMPIFVLGEWFGMRDERALVWCVVLLQMALGLVLTWRCMRVAARLAGRTGAIAAGFLVATNPVFLQYSTQPVSDLAAGVCIAFALELLLERGSFRRALLAGLWLGVGFMVAYKTLLVTLLVIAFVFMRDRLKHTATWRGLVPGVLIALFVQSTIDGFMHGQFGASVFNYLAANVGGVVCSMLMRLSRVLHSETIYQFGTKLYDLKEAALGNEDWVSKNVRVPPAKQPLLFYWHEAPTFLAWPVIAVGAISIVRVLAGRLAKAWMLFVILVVAILVMSNKGSKDLRLLLPLLPFIAPLLGYGWEWIASGLGERLRGTRGLASCGGAAAVLVLSLGTLSSLNVKHFGGYWAASDWIDEYARSTYTARLQRTPFPGPDGEPEPLQVGYAYHWAVYLRGSALVRVVKLPWQLNLWSKYAELQDGGVTEKAQDFATLQDLDVFVVHLPILTGNPDLMSFVNSQFEVAAAFYDQRTYEDIGPIFVLVKRTSDPHARRFFDLTRGVSERDFVREHQLEPRLDFVDPGTGDRLRLLGVEFTTVPPMDFGWITYHWRVPERTRRDWWILDRLTSPYEANTWENNHELAYGTRPTSTLAPDEIVSEGYLVVPSRRAYDPTEPVRPIGNAYRRGDRIPTRTWMKLVTLDRSTLGGPAAPTIEGEMLVARSGAERTLRTSTEFGLQELPDGTQFAADDFVRVASFFIPVREPWRLPDDGRPVED